MLWLFHIAETWIPVIEFLIEHLDWLICYVNQDTHMAEKSWVYYSRFSLDWFLLAIFDGLKLKIDLIIKVHVHLIMYRLLCFSWEGELNPGASIPALITVARDVAISFLKVFYIPLSWLNSNIRFQSRIIHSTDEDEIQKIAMVNCYL